MIEMDKNMSKQFTEQEMWIRDNQDIEIKSYSACWKIKILVIPSGNDVEMETLICYWWDDNCYNHLESYLSISSWTNDMHILGHSYSNSSYIP